MVIAWDSSKRISNLAKHGLDFADLDLEFFLTATIGPARQDRFAAFGSHRGRLIAVVFGRLGREGLAVISMRPANKKEGKLYVPS